MLIKINQLNQISDINSSQLVSDGELSERHFQLLPKLTACKCRAGHTTGDKEDETIDLQLVSNLLDIQYFLY